MSKHHAACALVGGVEGLGVGDPREELDKHDIELEKLGDHRPHLSACVPRRPHTRAVRRMLTL
eukprot:COSAG05_NODE_4831_length_1356_cov_1.687351_1_plen_62_part_10